MPIFDFRCRDCGHQFELLVRNGEAPACPHCATKSLDKLMSAPAGHVAGGALPIAAPGCPPPSAGSCGPGCCRHAH